MLTWSGSRPERKDEREGEQSKMQLNAFLTRKFDMEREIENFWLNDKDESRVTFNKAAGGPEQAEDPSAAAAAAAAAAVPEGERSSKGS